MAKAITAKTKELFCSNCRTWKQPKGGHRAFGRLTGINQQQEKSADNVICSNGGDGDELQNLPLWVPHPKTGIYFPKGQERVMDDVPEGSASLAETFWLRSTDGADKPDPDLYFHHDI